ncbi:hypothetical protein BDW62DRAFT_176467 [Aspergillus aurantiobrunneus]
MVRVLRTTISFSASCLSSGQISTAQVFSLFLDKVEERERRNRSEGKTSGPIGESRSFGRCCVGVVCLDFFDSRNRENLASDPKHGRGGKWEQVHCCVRSLVWLFGPFERLHPL